MERIVIVDENDNVIGEEEKGKCHDGGGILHRAFLTMIFDESGKLVLARRSKTKRLWPGYWDGTVASHLLKGETYEQASGRRLAEEVGLVRADIRYLFKFRYKAGYRDIGTEHEICAVTVVEGVTPDRITPDRTEISEIRSAGLPELIADLTTNGDTYTPWLVLALEHMRKLRLLSLAAVSI